MHFSRFVQPITQFKNKETVVIRIDRFPIDLSPTKLLSNFPWWFLVFLCCHFVDLTKGTKKKRRGPSNIASGESNFYF